MDVGKMMVRCNGRAFLAHSELAKAWDGDEARGLIESQGGDYAEWLELKLLTLIGRLGTVAAMADEQGHDCVVTNYIRGLASPSDNRGEENDR